MKARTKEEAWAMANEIFPTDYIKNDDKSARAGCDVYESTLPGFAAWISDLGCRLEINLPGGVTANIWIEATEAVEVAKNATEAAKEATSTEAQAANKNATEAEKTAAAATTFEIELSRHNVTPAQFLAYVRKAVDKKGGRCIRSDLDLDYFRRGDDLNFNIQHDGMREKSISRPYEMQTFWRHDSGAMYNEICEFEFDDEKTGHGYYYLINRTATV